MFQRASILLRDSVADSVDDQTDNVRTVADDLEIGRQLPPGLHGIRIAPLWHRWVVDSRFTLRPGMRRWVLSISRAVLARMHGPWRCFLQRWHRLVLLTLTAVQTYTMGAPYPFGKIPRGQLDILRRRCN